MENSALALYRRILRVAQTWQGGKQEQIWIKEEARKQFTAKKHLSDANEIQQAILKGHQQVDVAIHYQIPYPRLHHAKPGTIAGDEELKPQYTDSNTNTKSKRYQRMQKFQNFSKSKK